MSAASARSRAGGPLAAIAIGGLLALVGGYLLVTGLLREVERPNTVIGLSSDPSLELQALTGAPGSSLADLAPGVYQVIGIGPALTEAPADAAPGEPIIEQVEFDGPSLEIVGPNGTVKLAAPMVIYLVDAPTNDAVTLGEFTAREAGSYQLFTKDAGDGAVQRVGIRARVDGGQVRREASADFTAMLIGTAVAVLGIGLILFGLGRRKRALAPAAPVKMVRNAGGVSLYAGGTSATGGMRSPILMDDSNVAPRSAIASTGTDPAAPPPVPPAPVAPPLSPVAPPAAPPPPPPAAPAPPPPSDTDWPPRDWPPAQPPRSGTPLPPPPAPQS
jgi:hypothetical protein